MAWLPRVNVEIVRVDVAAFPLPPRRLPGPRSVAPSKNSTLPVGFPPLPVVFVTVAVNVTDWPRADGLAPETTATLVTASTVWLTEPLPPRKLSVGV